MSPDRQPGPGARRAALRDGVGVAALALAWGALALATYHLVGGVGRGPLAAFGRSAAFAFALAGVINVVLYLFAGAARRRDRR